MREIFCFLFLPAVGFSQVTPGLDALTLPEELNEQGEEDEPQTKDILVISNRFPNDLNFFCFPRTGLQHDRLCFGQLDAYALACADDTPPLQLVPFCIAFKEQCSHVNYPQETWCNLERTQYKKFCTRHKRSSCKSCHYDISCTCEPFQCIWQRYGFETARWCQRYELFCNNKARREKAHQLVDLMQDSIKVHYKCFHMFNLANFICNPFRRQFDQQRCMKFLFDCELISDFSAEEKSKEEPEEEKVQVVTKKIIGKEKGEIVLTEKEKEELKKIQLEEEKLQKEIAKAEAERKGQGKIGEPVDAILNKGVPALSTPATLEPHPFEKITLKPAESIISTTIKPIIVLASLPPGPIPFEKVHLPISTTPPSLSAIIQTTSGVHAFPVIPTTPKNPFRGF